MLYGTMLTLAGVALAVWGYSHRNLEPMKPVIQAGIGDKVCRPDRRAWAPPGSVALIICLVSDLRRLRDG
jgi:hypothetical protein